MIWSPPCLLERYEQVYPGSGRGYTGRPYLSQTQRCVGRSADTTLQQPCSASRSSSRTGKSVLRIVLSFLLATSFALAGPKVAPDVPKAGPQVSPNTPVDIIVRFRTVPTKDELKQFGSNGQLKKVFNTLKAVHAQVPLSVVSLIEADPNVIYISPNRLVKGRLEYAEPTINANLALQYGWNGTNIGVAVIDSGIAASHPDLQNRVVYAESFVPGDTNPNDAFGHGTHVAGIVAGNGTASSQADAIFTFRGIAPNANLINLRVLDANGAGDDSAVMAAVEQAIALKDQYNIRVVSLSLGRPITESYVTDPLCQAVERPGTRALWWS